MAKSDYASDGGSDAEASSDLENLQGIAIMCKPRGGETPLAKKSAKDKKKRAMAGAACDICLRNQPMHLFTNIGSDTYPKYRCNPCNNASKSYDRALRSRGVDISEMKKRAMMRYVKQVIGFRISHPHDADGHEDRLAEAPPDSLRERKSKIAHHIEETYYEKSVLVIDEVEYFNRRQHMAYHMLNECMDKKEAENWWDTCVDNPSIAKRLDKGGNTCLCVQLPLRVQKITKKGTKRSYREFDDKPESDDDGGFKDSCKKRLRSKDSDLDLARDLEGVDPLFDFSKACSAPDKLKKKTRQLV